MATKSQPIGVVGVGLMGTAVSKRLCGAGFDVPGHDVDPQRLAWRRHT